MSVSQAQSIFQSNIDTSGIEVYSGKFINWASGIESFPSWQNAMDTSMGMVSVGTNESAKGPALQNGVISLGDGGYVIATFEFPITNKVGYDFAVFENAFSENFLELAHVEVSSDGVNYFRFCSHSNIQDTLQTDTFGLTNSQDISNLAGKHIAGVGTGFDLEELEENPLLIKTNITHVKIIDVVGSINPTFGTLDCDSNFINDPFPTPFPSSGFDLDAIGVIHDTNPNPIPYTSINESASTFFDFKIISNEIMIEVYDNELYFDIISLDGKILESLKLNKGSNTIPLKENGLHIFKFYNKNYVFVKKISTF